MKQSPIVGIQFDYDLSSADKLVPDQVFPGSLFVEKGYSFSEGPLGLLAFSFSLDEILPEENPVSFFFSERNMLTIALLVLH